MFDLGHAFLFILKTPIRLGERIYSQVWGTTDHEYVGDKLFIKVGGFCNEVLIDPDEIRFSLPMAEAPHADEVLVRTNEYDDVETDLLESVRTVE